MWIASQRTRFQLKKSRVAIALNPMTATIQASAMPRRQGAATDSPAGQVSAHNANRKGSVNSR